jgi:hypothetical protein
MTPATETWLAVSDCPLSAPPDPPVRQQLAGAGTATRSTLPLHCIGIPLVLWSLWSAYEGHWQWGLGAV